MKEHRDRQRLDLARLAFAKLGNYARGGLLKDISSSGALLEFVYPTGRAEHSFGIGDRVEIEVDGFETLPGEIVRIGETGIAVQFDLAVDKEDELISRIMVAANQMPLPDEYHPPASND